MLCSIARTFVRRDLLPVIINFSRKASSRAGNFTVQVDEGNSLSSNMEGVEVKLITQVDFHKLIKEEDKLIVIDFFATWCGPCKMISPKIKQFANNYVEKVVFVKVDVDDQEELAQECNIEAMPTFLLYKGGSKVGEMKGANAERLEELVKEHM